jgi:hypothetical protein
MRGSKGIESVDKAFKCPSCGESMGVPNSNSLVLYCANYDCTQDDITPNNMSVEQRFYAKVAKQVDDPRSTKESVKAWLEETP